MTWKVFWTALLQKFLGSVVDSAAAATGGAVKDTLTPKSGIGKNGKTPT